MYIYITILDNHSIRELIDCDLAARCHRIRKVYAVIPFGQELKEKPEPKSNLIKFDKEAFLRAMAAKNEN